VSVRQHLATLLLFAALIAAWQLLYLFAGDVALASPLATVRRMVEMLQTRSFWENARETGYAFLCALALALAGGVGLGVALGLRRLAAVVAEPILITLYSIPKVTLYPLVLLTFGLGISAKVAFGVMHGLIPIAIFAMNAIRQMKPVYLRSSRVLRLTSLQTATRIVLPAILPELLSGVRIGFSLTLLGVLIGEMFASRHGLGFLITNAMGLGDMATIMAVALFLTAFALTANGMFSSLNRMTHR
jgi:NitT/TauT family transport system permease protein